MSDCNQPRYLRQLHNDDVLSISCNECLPCLLKKSRNDTLDVTLSTQTFKYIFFVNLDYATPFIPIMRHKSNVNKGCKKKFPSVAGKLKILFKIISLNDSSGRITFCIELFGSSPGLEFRLWNLLVNIIDIFKTLSSRTKTL